MNDNAALAVEVYEYWQGRLSFWRDLEKQTLDAEIAQELAEKAAIAEKEVARMRAELESLGASISEGGIVIWNKGEL